MTTALFVLLAGLLQPGTPDRMTAELNAIRASHGLPPLATSPALTAASQRWAGRMALTGRVRHGGGEHIIAAGQRTVTEALASWMASPGHRAWLLSRTATEVGWGHATGRRWGHYWAGTFNVASPRGLVRPRR